MVGSVGESFGGLCGWLCTSLSWLAVSEAAGCYVPGWLLRLHGCPVRWVRGWLCGCIVKWLSGCAGGIVHWVSRCVASYVVDRVLRLLLSCLVDCVRGWLCG